MLRSIIFLLGLLLSLNSYAQQPTWFKGAIIDKENKIALPFAVISLKHTNQATVSGEDGYFYFAFIKHPFDTIRFSMMGFVIKEIPADSISNTDSLSIELPRNPFVIPVINIEGISAKETLRKAIKNMRLNFPDSATITESFFHQVHREDNQYVRLVEAIVITQEQPFNYYRNNSEGAKVFIKALRRSNVYEENGEQHGEHLMDLLNEDPVKFPLGSVLNEKGIEFFSFHFVESDLPNTIVISFLSVASRDEKILKGTIWIDRDLVVIKRLVTESFPNPNSKVRHFAARGEPFLWVFRNGIYDIEFKELNGRYLANHILKSYTHYLYDAKVNSLAHIVEENFEWQHHSFPDGETTKYHFTPASNLYSQKYIYNKNDWVDFPMLADEILKDLEKEMPVEKQFSKNGK